MLIMGFRVSLSWDVYAPQLYYESPINSHLAHTRFGEGIDPKDDYVLSVVFENNEERVFDVKPYLEIG